MNLSGKAVQYWMDKENISLENILLLMIWTCLSVQCINKKEVMEARIKTLT
jgi:hypothetical protein